MMSNSAYISQVFEGDTVMVIESGFIVVAKGTVVRKSATRFTVRTENAAADVPALVQFSRKTGKQVGGDLYIVEYDSAIYEDALAEMVEVEEPAQADKKESAEMSSKYTETEIPHRYKVLAYHFDEPIVLVADSEREGKAVSISLDEYEAQVERDVAEYWESKSEEPAQVATKVEARAENLKHLDKPEEYGLTPHGLVGRGIAYKVDIGNASFYFRKMYQGRNKNSQPFPYPTGDASSWGWLRHFVAPASLSPAALVRWFPVALGNTVFHPAVACHYLQYFIANTRHYSNLTRYAATTCRDNKAQVNRYHALKTG